jgi:hypothetical protein
MVKSFGRDYVPDSRDRKYSISRKASVRKSRHWRLGEVTDQGNQPHCVGHAWSNWFTSSPMRQNHIMSPSGIYTLAQYFDEWEGQEYDGTSVRGACKLLEITGHISQYRWAWDVETLAGHVLEVSPVVIGVNWYAGMMRPKDGHIKPTGRRVGGHAVLCYGVSLNGEYASLRNSWGEGWGTGGNCRIGLDDLNRLLGEDGECCTANERRA